MLWLDVVHHGIVSLVPNSDDDDELHFQLVLVAQRLRPIMAPLEVYKFWAGLRYVDFAAWQDKVVHAPLGVVPAQGATGEDILVRGGFAR